MSTFTSGDYTATVTNDNFVIITYKGTTIDNPGPWDSQEAAGDWAAAIVGKWSATGHESDQNGER